MEDWILTSCKLPEVPETEDQMKGYLITVTGRSVPFVAYFSTKGKWVNAYFYEYMDVVAWMPLPDVYKPPKKYRWRLDPAGYGAIRDVYLTAVSPVLTVAEWDHPVDKSRYKNIFTEEEYLYLVEHWQFDPKLFAPEEYEV